MWEFNGGGEGWSMVKRGRREMAKGGQREGDSKEPVYQPKAQQTGGLYKNKPTIKIEVFQRDKTRYPAKYIKQCCFYIGIHMILCQFWENLYNRISSSFPHLCPSSNTCSVGPRRRAASLSHILLINKTTSKPKSVFCFNSKKI